MPPVEEVGCYADWAVVLDAGAYNKYGRKTTTDVPREVMCRWIEDVTSVGGQAVDTEKIAAQMELLEELEIGTLVWHGRLDQFPRDWVNDAPGELMEVANTHRSPSDNGRTFKHTADLSSFRDELPEVG